MIQGGRFEAKGNRLSGLFEARFVDIFQNWTKFNRNGAFNEAKYWFYISLFEAKTSRFISNEAKVYGRLYEQRAEWLQNLRY